MIWHIAKKEFHQNILTSRFVIGTILCVIFVVLVKISLISDYSLQIDAYNSSVNTNEERMKKYYTYSEISPRVHKPPEILSILSQGVSKKLGGIIGINRTEVPYDSEHYVMDNPFLRVFKSFDIVLVFKLIMSLLALLFAFDMFSGEKETGTLKLSLAGSTSRAEVFIGKYIGGMLSLTIAFAFSFIIGLLFMQTSPVIGFNSDILTRLLLIYFVSIVFTASFFSIGAFISSLTHRSVTSLAVSLFIWVILVIVLPNLGNYTAAQLKTVEPLVKIEAEVSELQNEMVETVQKYMEENPHPEGGTIINGSQSPTRGYYRFQIANLNQMKFYDHFIPYSEEKRRELANRSYDTRKRYLDNLAEQAKIVNIFTIFSPVRLYENIARRIARTDLYNYQEFLNQSQIYRNSMLRYFNDKDVYNKYRFTSIMERGEAPNVTSDEVFTDGSEAERIWHEAGERINWDTRPNLNLDDFPKFNHQSENIPVSINAVLPYFAGLIFIVLVLILLTYFVFVKYDVR
ncbi:ABC transporter permease subunit [candidate division KSB1 bacterium]